MEYDIFGNKFSDDDEKKSSKKKAVKRRSNDPNEIDRDIARRKRRAKKEQAQIDAFNRTGRKQFELDFVDDIVSECLNRFKNNLLKENKS